MKKLLRAQVIAAFLVLSLVAVPARALIAPLVVYLGGTALFADALELSATIIGGIIAFVKFDTNETATGQATQIMAQLASDAPLPAPAGWTASDGHLGSKGKPTPPSAASAYTYYTSGRNHFGNPQQSCQDYVYNVLGGGAYTDPSGTASPPANGTCHYNWNGVAQAPVTITTLAGCQTGYTLSGGICSPSNLDTVPWPGDGVCTILRSGDSYSFAAQDPDCWSAPKNFSIGTNGWTASGPDGHSFSLATNTADHTTTITENKPQSNNTTLTIQNKVTAAGSGTCGAGNCVTTITGTSQTTAAGTGSLAGTGTIDVQIDTSDLNKEVTQGQIRDNTSAIKDNTQALKDTLDTSGVTDATKNFTGATDSLNAANTARQSALTDHTSVTDLGLGLSITWPTSGCTDPSFSMPDGHGTLVVPMCSHRDDIQAIMNWLVSILCAWTLFQIGIGALSTKG